MDDTRVGVYVGTYGKYNNGYLDGKWMYPADYDSREDFIDACYKLHNDEDPNQVELMFQDVDYLPNSLYSESYFSEEAFNYAKFIDDNPSLAGAAEAYVDEYGDWDEDDFESRYYGEFDSLEDFAYEFIDSIGGIKEAVQHPEDYFDYESFGRDLKLDLDEEDEYDAELLDLSDYACGVRYIDDVYGDISELDQEIIETHFDYEAFARDLSYGDIAYVNGYVFWNN